MELNIINIKGEDTGRKITLEDAIFAVEPNDHSIYLDVKRIRNAQRQGTAKTRERSERSGSTRKLGKQKGGGGARRGDINSPLLVGGARVFGPKPRDYSIKLNKKVKELAKKSALSYKASGKNIMVIEDINFDAPKTKDLVLIAKNLKISDKKAMIVLKEDNKNVYLSARNLEKLNVVTISGVNTYTILDAKTLVLTESSVEKLQSMFNA